MCNNYVNQFKLSLAGIYNVGVPIEDLVLNLELNGVKIDESELERYIVQLVEQTVEATRDRVVSDVLKVVSG